MLKKLLLGMTALTMGYSAQIARAQAISSSANPSVPGSAITLSTNACGGSTTYAVQFWWAQANTGAWKTIGNAAAANPYRISWTPPAAGTYNIKATANQPSVCPNFTSPIFTQTVSAPPSYQGYVNPKYVVVGVTYAAPGPSSYTQYTTGATLATTKGTSSSFSSGKTVSIQISNGTGIKGWASGHVTVSNQNSVTQASSTSSSVTLSLGSQIATKTPGTPNAYSPLTHDYDVIWLWLNPVALYTVTPSTPNTIAWNGYGFDTTDQPAVDIWPVFVGYLNGHFGALDSQDAKVLARSWAAGQTWPSGQGPGLTQADFNNILTADPFTNAAYSVKLASGVSPSTTTDGRYTISGGTSGVAQSFDYKQAAPGQTAITQTYENTYSNVSTLGSSTTTTTQETFGIDVAFTSTVFIDNLSEDLKYSQTLIWTDMASKSTSATATKIDTLSITGPPCNATTAPCVPTYTGVSEFNVYQDNIYGTFMFNPVQ